MVVTINRYNKFPEYFGDNTIDLDAGAGNPKAELYNSTHVFTATHTQRSDVSANALATANGYTNPGQNLTSPTWVEASGVITLDAADNTWSASGGSIGPADDCVLYSDLATAPVDALNYSIDFGGSETAGDGTDFKITFNASGIMTLT